MIFGWLPCWERACNPVNQDFQMATLLEKSLSIMIFGWLPCWKRVNFVILLLMIFGWLPCWERVCYHVSHDFRMATLLGKGLLSC